MKPAEFETHLDRYGVDPEGWPPDLLALREGLLASSDAARKLLERQARFELLFVEGEVPEPPDTALLVGRTVSLVQEQSGLRALGSLRRDWLRPRWAHAAGLVACVLIGFVLGLTEPGSHHVGFDPLDLVDGSGLEQIDD